MRPLRLRDAVPARRLAGALMAVWVTAAPSAAWPQGLQAALALSLESPASRMVTAEDAVAAARPAIAAAQNRPPVAAPVPPAVLAIADAPSVGPSNGAEAGPAVGFYRFPALRNGRLWFTAEGDLWRVPLAGGAAERVTTHPGAESRPEPSPDGRWVAFVGAYEGPSEVYVMPTAGGVPKRLSWDGQGVAVWGWTPDREVLITAPALTGQPERQLFAVDPLTLRRRALPAAQASDGAVSADGRTLYFTRNGLRSDNVRRYRGGAIAQLWSLELSGSAEARPLLQAAADTAVNARRPMPYASAQGPRIAYLSDRDGSVNLWSVDARGGDARQHTRHAAADIRHAGIDGTRVVYAIGADLRTVDLATDADTPLAITLGGDFDQQRLRWVKRPQPFLTGQALAPDGERVALTVRGHLATLGVGPLRRAELPVPADARCRDSAFSHDGRQLFALCDIGGEVEAWRFAANGSGAPQPVTRGADTLRTGLFPSPDGRWLAHTDKEGRLSLTALAADGAGGTTRVIDQARSHVAEPTVAWSPDSRALVFGRVDGGAGYRERLVLYALGAGDASGTTHLLTSDRYDSASPSFTPDGKWLYFLSDRAFTSLNRSPWGDRNLGPYFDRRTRVYALALQPGLRFPFQPRDELDPAPPAPRPPAAVSATATAGAASATVSVTPPAAAPAASAASTPSARRPAIDVRGLAERLHEVPLAPGNYTQLVADDKRLYLLDEDTTAERRRSLRTLAVDNNAPQPELFAAEVKDFALTPDRKKLLLVRSAAGDTTGDILLLDAAPKLPPDVSKNTVRWTDWQIAVEPRAEWRQMFIDAWRLHRDYFFDREMRGVDWAALRRRFEPLVARVTDRAELNELLAQMVGELGALHSQVATRDLREGPDEVAAAGLGARFTKVANGFRIDRIYRGDPELPSEAAPLRVASLPPGATARPAEGDVVTAVNGRPTAAVADLSELLRGQAGRQTLLELQAPVPGSAVRQVIVLPVTAEREAQLRTGDWERSRAQRAAERSQGRVGYLRLRAMGGNDIGTFAREFYAQLDRDGLVIDVRGNNGGNIDSWVIEKLLRRAWVFWQPRSPAGATPYPNMQQAFSGALAVLVDENTYSDGETFAEGVKRLQLGALIGKRTSGAGVWLSDRNRLLDNGLMRAAETGQFTRDGSWLIEGRGVAPDIEVDNPPRNTFEGGDAQLDAAVDHLLQRIAAQPRPVPAPWAYPRP